MRGFVNSFIELWHREKKKKKKKKKKNTRSRYFLHRALLYSYSQTQSTNVVSLSV